MTWAANDDRFGYPVWAAPEAPAAAPVAERPRAETVQLSGLQSWDQLFGYDGPRSLSADRAMRHGAVFACIRVLAGTLSQLPWKTYEQGDDGISIYAPKHRYARLLRLRPNPRMSAVMFWRMVFANSALNGNGYAWIERKRNGDAKALWPIPKSRCSPKLMTEGPLKGRIVYTITLDSSETIAVDMADMLHIPGGLEWNGVECKSPLSSAAASVGIALEADEFALRHFENDATPPVVLTYSKKVSAEQAKEIKALWQTAGTGENRGKVRLVHDGGEVDQLEMNLEDALLIATRNLSRNDIAMLFGVPPHMIGAIEKQTSWGTGVEQQSIGFVTYTLQGYITAAEQEIEEKIFEDDGHHCEADVRALMRGDFKARMEGYRAALGRAGERPFMEVNEVRKLENLAPHPDGTGLKPIGIEQENEDEAEGDEPPGDDRQSPREGDDGDDDTEE